MADQATLEEIKPARTSRVSGVLALAAANQRLRIAERGHVDLGSCDDDAWESRPMDCFVTHDKY